MLTWFERKSPVFCSGLILYFFNILGFFLVGKVVVWSYKSVFLGVFMLKYVKFRFLNKKISISIF